ncbi:hypothetical protein C8P63_10196 [Melghirimyces profundicolus]|uniref:Xylose isomerase-like TIM barrel protein n=1 Tax=Melghirimyces profundicolus TaxID=1242148 RepID=A0A2T6C960_9BACL|nr:hypothetical protein [Melghirimyces profundicolus]PTX64877.1 hypothetical protein C8P63_10196 [Melghirimyces profundicolus]
MLFSNPTAAQTEAELHQLHQVADQGFKRTVIQLPSSRYNREELLNLFRITDTKPIAFRAPRELTLGKAKNFNEEAWSYWFHTVASLYPDDAGHFICHGSAVTLGELFEFLDQRPRNFNALHDYKTQYVETVIDQLKRLEAIARPLGIRLLLENAPMGAPAYFEPGKGRICPALRTPRHLLRVTEATETRICFDAAHARITSNVFTYMHRSRSLFAAATEKEILNATRDWPQFYQQIKEQTAMVRLSYAVSWGDTPQSLHIPFPETAYPELLEFAETLNPRIPVVLPSTTEKNLREMMKTFVN